MRNDLPGVCLPRISGAVSASDPAPGCGSVPSVPRHPQLHLLADSTSEVGESRHGWVVCRGLSMVGVPGGRQRAVHSRSPEANECEILFEANRIRPRLSFNQSGLDS